MMYKGVTLLKTQFLNYLTVFVLTKLQSSWPLQSLTLLYSSFFLLNMWASSILFSFCMWSGKEVSLDCISESSQWTGKITKAVSSLALTCTPIGNFMYVVDNALRFLEVIWYQFLNVQDSTAVSQWKFSSCMRMLWLHVELRVDSFDPLFTVQSKAHVPLS